MAQYETDNYASGYALAAKGGVYPQWAEFDTNVSPGANIGNVVLALNDEIRLCWLPTPGRLEWYAIDIPDLDGGADLVFDLRDGLGNVIQSAIIAGQAGGRITAHSAAVRQLAIREYVASATSYLTLLVTTAAASAPGTTGNRVVGNVCYRSS